MKNENGPQNHHFFVVLKTYLTMPRRTVCVLISLIGLCSVVPLVLLIFIDTEPQTESTIAEIRGLPRRKALDFEHGYTKDDLFDLNMQIKELENIKASVRNELRELDGKRWEILKESTFQNELLTRLRKDVSTAKKELESVKNSVAKAKQEPTGASTKAPSTPPPIIILPQQPHKIADSPPLVKSSSPAAGRQSMHCTFETCFDFSVCPLIRKFTVHVYNTRQNINLIGTVPNQDDVTEWLAELEAKDLLATSPVSACLFIVIIGDVEDYKTVEARLKELEYWRGNGLNHLIIELPSIIQSQLHTVDTGHAMVASAQHEHLKRDFDVFSAPATTNAKGKFREHLPLLLSAQKPKLMYFHGECQTGKNTDVLRITVDGLLQLKEHIIDVDIKVSCNAIDKSYQSRDDECSMCDNQLERFARLSQSKFALIPEIPGALMLVRIIEALRSTSVPVIIGTTYPLPFDGNIDWNLAVLRIPAGHFSQIHLILRSIEAFDVQQFCLQGRFLYESYFRSPVQILNTVVATVRSRTMHPAPAILTTSFHATKQKAQISASSYIAMPSQQWRHNFTNNMYQLWNKPPGPFKSYPTTPFDPVPLSGSQYVSKTDAELKQLPPHIVLAGGITGPYFEDYLLGNIPNEQFTVVMLTYQRNTVMVEAVERLSGLPHLHKVIVVWNNPEDIPPDMTLPNIDVPIEVCKVVIFVVIYVSYVVCKGKEKQPQQSVHSL